MRVSVIIPNYNHEKFLRERIDSVLAQTYQDFEVIILDDCSTDNSRDVIDSYKEDPRVSKILFNKENSGSPFKQWELGIASASGDLIWIAESDDVAQPQFLEKMVSLIDEGVDVAYCRSKTIDENGNEIHEGRFWPDGLDEEKWKSDFKEEGMDFLSSSLIYRNVIPNVSSAVFKRVLVEDIPDINQKKFAGDWEFWICLCSKGRIAFSKESLNSFRKHQATSRSMKSASDEMQRFEEYFDAVRYATQLLKENGKPYSIDRSNYDWIWEQIKERKRLFGLRYYFPMFIPGFLRIPYFRYLMK